MIKALRIASIIAVVLAGVFFVFPVVFGVRRDEQAEQFLKSPGVIEKFSRDKGGKKAESEDQASPLVEQAKAFALYLNPPKPKEPEASPSSPAVKSVRKPKTVSPKFDLIGTSFYESHPELSLALIDEPGAGFRWIRQSNKVGHLIIEQIKDGVVVIRDGERTFELVAERPKRINLVKGISPGGPDAASAEEPPDSEGLEDTDEPISRKRPPKRKEIEVRPEEILSKLRAIKKTDFGPDVNDSEYSSEQRAKLDSIISEFESMRITDQEAKKLGQLGEDLNDIYQDPNRAEAEYDVNEVDANFSDANFNDANSPRL